MKLKSTVIDPQDLIPQLLELLDETDTVPLLISGNSMSPFLIHGRDTVFLSKIITPPQRGDMKPVRHLPWSAMPRRFWKKASVRSKCWLK